MTPRADRWGPDDIGDLTGRTAVVTGANSGVGYETALELAAHGAHVVMACRNRSKAADAADRIVGIAPQASVEVVTLDLSSLESVRDAAAAIAARHARIDVLVNNAGVMGAVYQLTGDGFELQTATNHLGPFAFTGRLLPTVLVTPGSRVVTVSSAVHRAGRLDPGRLGTPPEGRSRWLIYADTKLANLAFTDELQRRLEASREGTIAVAAHPGWARTNLVASGPTLGVSGVRVRVGRAVSHLGQAAAAGALPILYGAVAPGVAGGGFYGPGGVSGLAGPPVEVRSHRRSNRRREAARLWEASERLTGVRYPLDGRPADRPDGGGTSPSPG
jgi:NAD(P)-dependent dehydrogenase (short-subunit alcohol dehydrogenase family)